MSWDRTETMSISNISHAVAPNPCTNALFQPPIYSISNVSVVKSFVGDYGSFRGIFDFSVRDAANNYSLNCSWGRGEARGYGSHPDQWGWMNCVDPVTGTVPPIESRITTLLNLDSPALLANKSLQSPARIAQYWYCDIVGGAYPEAFQARADIFLDVVCPGVGTRDTAVSCNITSQPVTIKAQWIPRGTLFPGTPRLERRPTTPPTSRGIDPPPSRDCTDVSFTYPDWTLNDFTYKQPVSWDNPAATASLNLSLTSRATGSRVRCRWGADAGVTEWWPIVSDFTMIPLCTAEVPDPLHSNGVFLVRFNTVGKMLHLEQSWELTAHLRRTNFTAQSSTPDLYEISVPLYCSSGICTADTPYKIKGRLTSPVQLSPAPLPPPLGASTPNCLWTSQRTGSLDSPLRLSHFLWQATTIRTTTHYPGPYDPAVGEPSPYNRTLQVELKNGANNVTASCAFADAALDGETDKWWPCFRDRASQDEHVPLLRRTVETWVQFSAKTGQLRANQTWYCLPDGGATPYKITAQARTPTPSGGSLSSLVCGEGNNTWSAAPCPRVIFGPSGESCDYTYRARWCTLGDRDGNANYWLGPLVVPTENVDVVRLPAGDLTEPEPTSEVWSCTAASLGRGPVTWALQQSDWFDFFAQTDWFGVLGNRQDVLSTMFQFNLNSSVFAGFPPTKLSKDGVVRELGITQETAGWTLTPWVRTFDPTRVYTDQTEYWDISNPGWKFYNALAWSLRLDISTGYMELNHSWYCDDKDPERPIVFNGTWNGHVPLACDYGFPGPRTGDVTRQGVTCRLTGGKKEFVVRPTVTHTVLESKIPYRVPHWCCS
ncbi:hypothetical protein B0H67DRAFT_551424 [Lasiosphaeris hirsuta]|uniref:Uncharacterized protein n=1 Tax=Lasiosphaeris hirsuta TaxID=260670 RepID=A0AA40B1N9_9PEZI|nr:hypothetical protein B0H67DRAFT_551424 [Lasiosphaeris hirsuta]